MAATRVQVVSDLTGVSSGATVTFASNVTVGNTVTVIMANHYAACPPTLTDNLGNSYTRVVTGGVASGVTYPLFAFTAPITTGGACTITLAMGCSALAFWFATEVAGLSASPFESYSVLNNASSPMFAGSVTPTVNGSYLMAAFLDASNAGTIVNGSAWAGQGGVSGKRLQDLIQTTAAAINADATSPTPGNINGYVVVFKAAASASTARRHIVVTPRKRPLAPSKVKQSALFSGSPRTPPIIPPDVNTGTRRRRRSIAAYMLGMLNGGSPE